MTDAPRKCRFFDHPASTVRDLGTRDATAIECDYCGPYVLLSSLQATIAHCSDDVRRALSWYTRDQRERGRPRPEIAQEDIDGIVRSFPPFSVPQKTRCLLLAIANASTYPGERIKLRESAFYMPLLRARSEKEIGFLLAQMRSRSLLETDNDRVHLTLQGWQEVEALRGVTERSRRVFVAMSFRPELDGAYDVGIRPAIEGVGLEAIRVDREQFNDKICDRIVAEIRACGALVAEVTGHRPGVYFEAGLAMGLGKPVVWACRRDELAAAHFDTRQYNHLVWETPEELHSRLSDRLRATIVPELRLHDP